MQSNLEIPILLPNETYQIHILLLMGYYILPLTFFIYLVRKSISPIINWFSLSFMKTNRKCYHCISELDIENQVSHCEYKGQ